MSQPLKSSPMIIVKATGEQEVFNPTKLMTSLLKAGASKDQASAVVTHIQRDMVSGMTTSEIYRHAFDVLRTLAQPVAARYSMKRAISELGPNGFPFEKFVAEIFKAEGYEALTDQIVYGGCVEHEVDVVAWKDDELIMVEAKFHNEPGIKSDLKVALYIKARHDDLKEGIYDFGGKERKITKFQLFTNTKFTDHAVRYAECKGLSLVGWNYPTTGNLEDLVTELGMHPLTSLTVLSHGEKTAMLNAGIVLCKQVEEQKNNLAQYGVPKEKVAPLLQEIKHLCG